MVTKPGSSVSHGPDGAPRSWSGLSGEAAAAGAEAVWGPCCHLHLLGARLRG